MSAPPVQIVGFSSSDKVPGYVGEVIYGAGPVSAASIPLTLLLVGRLASAGGTATANQDVLDVRDAASSDAAFGAGGELAMMCRAALAAAPNVQIKAAPLLADSGADVAATATITIVAGSAAGTWQYRIAGRSISGSIAATDSATDIAASIVAAVQADATMPASAANAAGVVTLTWKTKGARGNEGMLYQDKSGLNGTTSTLAGGSATTGDGVRFGATAGVGADTLTTLQSVLFPGLYDRMGVAQLDATTLASWKTHVNLKSGPLEMRPTHLVFAVGAATQPTGLVTGVNDQRMEGLWYKNTESHPCELAAAFAAIRTAAEQSDPDASYDGASLPGIAANQQPADKPGRSTLVSCLNNGITPVTTENGVPTIVRAITSHSLNGSVPDYRTLDVGDAVVPDYVRRDLGLVWTGEFKPANPRVSDDPAPEQRARPSGVATPTLWNQRVTKQLRGYERGINGSPPIIIDVDLNLPTSGYDSVAKRIMSLVPVVVAPTQHQLGVSIRQVA